MPTTAPRRTLSSTPCSRLVHVTATQETGVHASACPRLPFTCDATGRLIARTHGTTSQVDCFFSGTQAIQERTGVVGTADTMFQHQVYSAYGVVSFKNADWSDKGSDGYAQENLYQGMLLNAAIGWYFAGQSNVGRWYATPMKMTTFKSGSDTRAALAVIAASQIQLFGVDR